MMPGPWRGRGRGFRGNNMNLQNSGFRGRGSRGPNPGSLFGGPFGGPNQFGGPGPGQYGGLNHQQFGGRPPQFGGQRFRGRGGGPRFNKSFNKDNGGEVSYQSRKYSP